MMGSAFKLRLIASLTLATLACSVASAGSAFVSGAGVETDGDSASITILLACQVNYLSHTPNNRASVFRIQIDATNSCRGVSPTVINTQEYYLPARAAEAKLTSIDYDGTTFGSQVLTLSFSENVSLSIESGAVNDRLKIGIDFNRPVERRRSTRQATSRQVKRPNPIKPVFVINLESSIRPPTTADFPQVDLAAGHEIYFTTITMDGRTWYRTRLGFFDSKESASEQLELFRQKYPSAWIDIAKQDEQRAQRKRPTVASQKTRTAPVQAARKNVVAVGTTKPKNRPAISEDKLATLMSDGRSAMTEGKLSVAVQIYTKVLQYPEHEHMPEAQEYLALAREKNGQTAHAKAEYQRYLALYPEADGAQRVKQRLTALLANNQTNRLSAAATSRTGKRSARTIRQVSPWRVQTFFSQFYRRDVNQIDENDEVVSQSSLFSDLNFDARRRGSRYDFSARLSAGYRKDLLGADEGSGDDVRVSYAYADLADAKTGLRGRVGRQSRNTGGVLGRFDGLNLGYQVTERTLLNAVVGQPVNSASDGIDDSRTLYGLSANFGPIADNLDLGGFYVRQDADGLSDREAVGAELRYFDSKRSLWGLADYDISYKELGSVFLQGTWRFESQFALNAQFDRRRSPFLSTSNALIGQPFENLTILSDVFGEQALRQLSLDRSAITTTYTVGASHPLGLRLQLNANATQSTVSATPESGGVAATPKSVYRYYSMDMVASSLLREGDVSIIGLRYSQSESTNVTSISLDARYPFTRAFYINPRLRVDYREILSDSSTEWILTPGLRMQYRIGRKIRIELQAGRQFASRDTAVGSIDRDTYFINLGYQAFF